MMKRPWMVVSFALFLTATSCSKFLDKFSRLAGNGFTQVTFGKGNGRSSRVTMNGGFMIYIVGDTTGYRQALYFPNESAAAAMTPPLTLPNDLYRMVAVGFEGTGLSTSVRCGTPGTANDPKVTLSGGAANIDFTLSLDACFDGADDVAGIDAHPSSITGFKRLDFVSCSSAAVLSGKLQSSDCTPTPEHGNLHTLRSMKLSLLSYKKTDGTIPGIAETTEAISSVCLQGLGQQNFNNAASIALAVTSALYPLSNSNVLFSLGSGGGAYLSTDGGLTFSSVPSLPTSVYTVSEFAGNTSAAIAAVMNGLYRSTDGGATWSVISGMSTQFSAVAGNGTTFVANHYSDKHLFYSSDAGLTWSDIGSPGTGGDPVSQPSTFDIDSSSGMIVAGGAQFTAGNGAITYSSNAGTTWSQYNFNSAVPTEPVQVVKAYNGVIYAGTPSHGLFVSTDGATTWTQYCSSGCTNLSLPSNNVRGLWVQNGLLYIATSSGLAVSSSLTSPITSNITSYSTELGATDQRDILKVVVANSHIFAGATNASTSHNPIRISDTRSSGAGGLGYSSVITMPIFKSLGTAYPIAVKLQTFADPVCRSNDATYYFPEGLGRPAIPDKAVIRYNAPGSTNRVFFTD